MIRLKNKKKVYTLCSLLIVLSLGLSACASPQKETTTNNNAYTNQEEIKKETNNIENKQEEQKKVNETNTQNNNLPKFNKQTLPENEKPSFNTPWKYSENKSYSASIEGKGTEAKEEGVGKIYVKDKDNNIVSFELLDNKKISPIYVEWADNKNLFVIIGSAFGTVSKGGNLYLLNINTGKLSLVLEPSDKKQEIMSAQKVGSNISLKVNVYEDDNYTRSHTEKWIINSFDVNLKKKLEVKNSEGKVIYVINQ